MKKLNEFINETVSRLPKPAIVDDDRVDLRELEDAVKELAEQGMNAATAMTTFQIGVNVAKIISGKHNATYRGNKNLEELLSKYFNAKKHNNELYWYDKSNKESTINRWLKDDKRGTMENPNI